MSREPDPGALFDVLADDYARRMLAAADGSPKTAKALSDACDASLSTIYRRLSMLDEHGLIDERTTIGPDGAHRREYETALEGLAVDLADGEFRVTVETADDLADSFTDLWTDIRDETP
ncbi:ArsR/SmtB family transcription factor [Halovivax cerinus]|uniref:ArsR/SmtB family transcription factor n=1 Tax=Halovivax cerinus TaxID=1487865 RepID=A0ABD5NQB6_9EURY|nr:helix-turn-helix domain-containing protein [Halovivax cerinus]